MDIKLRARLAAYSKVETFQPQTSNPDASDSCDLVSAGPVREELIDSLFRTENTSVEQTRNVRGATLIDSLFKGD